MSNGTAKFITFIAGLVIGGGIAGYFLKTKYARIAEEEIESVREMYKRVRKEDVKDEIKYENDLSGEEHIKYEELASKYKKETDNHDSDDDILEKGDGSVKEPYIIAPEEFGNGGYVIRSLTYYSDKILTDEHDQVIPDPYYLVSDNFQDHFGEYEDDSVFVRNEDLETDFEILLDERSFYEVDDTL